MDNKQEFIAQFKELKDNKDPSVIKDIEQRVMWLLIHFPDCVDSYRMLYSRYFIIFEDFSEEVELFFTTHKTSISTVGRSSRKILEMIGEHFHRNQDTLKKKEEAQEEMASYAVGNKDIRPYKNQMEFFRDK